MNDKVEKFKLISLLDCPIPSLYWKNLQDDERLKLIESTLKASKYNEYFRVSRAEKSGEVFVSLLNQLSVKERGTYLLDFELLLKTSIDNALIVWCEPLGDKNSLRKLRGIEIKGGKYE